MCGHQCSQQWLCWAEQEAQGKGGVRLFAQSGGGGSGLRTNNRMQLCKVRCLHEEGAGAVAREGGAGNMMERSCWTGCLFRLFH